MRETRMAAHRRRGYQRHQTQTTTRLRRHTQQLQTPARPSRRGDKAGPQIFYVDSDGQRLDGRLFSVGSGSTFAYGVLDTGYSYDLSTAEALELAERSIFAATYRDAYSGGTVRIYHIDADGWKRIRETDSMELYFKFKAEATAA